MDNVIYSNVMRLPHFCLSLFSYNPPIRMLILDGSLDQHLGYNSRKVCSARGQEFCQNAIKAEIEVEKAQWKR